MATLAINGNLRIGAYQDAPVLHKFQKPHLMMPQPAAPDPTQLKYEKDLLAHQLKLAKSKISDLEHQLTTADTPSAADAPPPLRFPTPTYSTRSVPTDASSTNSENTSPTPTTPLPARLAATGYPPTTGALHIPRSISNQTLFSGQFPNQSSVSSSVSGYLSQLAPPSSPAFAPLSFNPGSFHRSSYPHLGSLPTSPTNPPILTRPGSRSIPVSPQPHLPHQTAFLHPTASFRSLHNMHYAFRGDDLRSQTSDDGRSSLGLDALDMFASEELGLGSVQEDVQVESLQAEVNHLKSVVEIEDTEKLHLQRRVAELEDANHSLHRQVDLLKRQMAKLSAAAEAGGQGGAGEAPRLVGGGLRAADVGGGSRDQ